MWLCVVWLYVFCVHTCVYMCGLSVCLCVCVYGSVCVTLNLLHVQSGKTRTKPTTEAARHTSVPLLGGPTAATRCVCVLVCVHAICIHGVMQHAVKLTLTSCIRNCGLVAVSTGVLSPCTRVSSPSRPSVLTHHVSPTPPPTGPLVVYQERTLTSSLLVFRPTPRPSPPRTASLPLH